MDHLPFFLSFFHFTFLLFNRQQTTAAPLNLFFSFTIRQVGILLLYVSKENEGFIERMNGRSVSQQGKYVCIGLACALPLQTGITGLACLV